MKVIRIDEHLARQGAGQGSTLEPATRRRTS